MAGQQEKSTKSLPDRKTQGQTHDSVYMNDFKKLFPTTTRWVK